MSKKHRLLSAITVVGSLAGCANMSSGEQRTLSGAAIGTAAGALIGELATGQPLHGAVLGAAAGAAVLIYTSELSEVQLACDRAIVMFGGRLVGELDAADADEQALLRAAYNLGPDSAEEHATATVADLADPPAGSQRSAAVDPEVNQ